MTPEVSDTYMFLPTAKEVWDAVRQTYSKAQDAAQVYEIKVRVSAMKQGTKSVTEYANSLQSLWQELYHYQCIKTKCSEDAAILKSFIEKDRVYDFLAGLNVEFDQVRVQILGKDEIPTLNETISLIRAEESRRGVMLEGQVEEKSAMMTRDRNIMKQGNGQAELSRLGLQGKDSKDSLWCTYCKKSRHTREKCWKLNGKPRTSSQDWGYKGGRKKSQGQAHMTATDLEITTEKEEFSKEEIGRLKELLESLGKSKTGGTCSLALSGKSVNSNIASDRNIIDSWIIDSGATDHMTNSSLQFKTYTPCPSNRKILVADGSLTTVAELRDIQITSQLTLKNVLHVPKLSTNLLSIQKLTHDLNCVVIFYPTHCEFQDQNTGKMIGRAKERAGLYYLETVNQSKSVQDGQSLSYLSTTNKKAVLLNHYRFGHPSFNVLKTMFPGLFEGIDVKHFHCDVCEYAKHKRASFPVNNKQC